MGLRNLGLGAAAAAAYLVSGCGGDGVLDPFADSASTGAVGATGEPGSSGGVSTAATSSAGPGSATVAETGVDSLNETTSTTASGSTGDASSSSSGAAESGSSTGGPPPECTMDNECPLGSVCENEVCVAGCNAMQACQDGSDCCGGTCVDLDSDFSNCGICTRVCDSPPNIDSSCEAGECTLGECDDGFYDCDGVAGCESTEVCTCVPNMPQSCYPGPAGTEGVGICAAGTQMCNAAGTGWGACTGFTLPAAADICANNMDDDCNGADDDIPDVDGDGWTLCDNDCCETKDQCSDPALVNPGAFEFVGNMVDDDCDPLTVDANPQAACSAAADFTVVTGDQMANAMDLCQFTTLAEPLPTRKWGVISAQLLTPAGANPGGAQLSDIQSGNIAILQNYGTGGVSPLLDNTMAGMSSGMMRDQNDPGYVDPNFGTAFGYNQAPPAAYLAANGGNLPSSASCSGNCPAGSGAFDGVTLRLTIRVPTNALSFAYSFRFFSSEFRRWVCTDFNDFYIARLTTGAAGIPADGNISFDSLGNPVSVNNGFFESCQAQGCYTCPQGTGALAGTGMQLADPNIGGVTGGGTVWLETTAPILPGEIMVLDLTIFDVSDANLDSLTLLDNFRWDIDPSDVGTNPQG